MKAKVVPPKLNFIPAPGYLLVEPLEAETKTASGIYLPDSVSEKPQKGKVLAAGADEITDSGSKKTSPAKAGDIVIYKKWGGNEVKISGKEYLFAKFEDILAVEG
ncbi:MAG: 10 kDa chaperonin [Candidatus Woesebacteria bacterium GW2011_GWA1_45_8]|uniref:Co-chaperonin GroES n=1 Tax=Candidatus Woesebacteria bacterium GW2011_GWA1_45_8 TaxID=1618559 RepID=A0A0G1QUS3_9BACT|nr:MAG: 10 kDa chaperonin [Candidatus Woesebacteria bacterium GW2011_GWA1_45_8]